MIRLDGGVLAEALGRLSRLALNNSNTPVYQSVLMSIKGNKLLLRATDLIAFAELLLEIDEQDQEEGTCLVVFEPLYHYLSQSTPEGPVTIDFDDKQFRIVSKRDRASPKLRSASDFISWPKWSELSILEADGEQLLRSIQLASGYVSVNLLDPRLYNVCVISDGSHSIVQATDGFSFIVIDVDLKTTVRFLLPHNATLHLPSVFSGEADKGGEQRVELGLGDSLLGVRTPRSRWFFRLSASAEQYPSLKDKVPSKHNLVQEYRREELLSILSRAWGFSDEKYCRTKLEFSEKGVKITSNTDESGQYIGYVAATRSKGELLSILVDAREMVKLLDAGSGSELIRVCLSDDHGPILMRYNDRENLQCVMYPLIEGSTSDEKPKE